MIKAYIFDIDGTLADCTHRLHYIYSENKDWDTFHNSADKDRPIIETIECAKALKVAGYEILIVTGRPDSSKHITVKWLLDNGINFDRIYMRKEGDHIPDFVLKKNIYDSEIKNDYEVLGVFEDRRNVVDMWRSLGIRCYHVEEGNY